MRPNKELVRYVLIEFGFVATIEVTNGIGNSTYGAKARQALQAQEFLRGLTDKRAVIASGLAYLVSQTEIDRSLGINVVVTVDRYETPRLEDVFEKMLDLGILRPKDSRIISEMLRRHDSEWSLQGFISGKMEELHKRARYISCPISDYMACLSVAKGLIMELYISSLLKEGIEEGKTFHRLRYRLGGKESDADVIVACRESNFYGAVQNLNQRPDIQAQVLSRRRN